MEQHLNDYIDLLEKQLKVIDCSSEYDEETKKAVLLITRSVSHLETRKPAPEDSNEKKAMLLRNMELKTAAMITISNLPRKEPVLDYARVSSELRASHNKDGQFVLYYDGTIKYGTFTFHEKFHDVTSPWNHEMSWKIINGAEAMRLRGMMKEICPKNNSSSEENNDALQKILLDAHTPNGQVLLYNNGYIIDSFNNVVKSDLVPSPSGLTLKKKSYLVPFPSSLTLKRKSMNPKMRGASYIQVKDVKEAIRLRDMMVKK